MITGRIDITDIASTRLNGTTSSLFIRASATGSVWTDSSWATIIGHRKSFQRQITEKIATTASAGRHSGSTMRRKIRHSPAPSMRAASISSSGSVSMYWRSRNTPVGVAAGGMIRPHRLFVMPRSRHHLVDRQQDHLQRDHDRRQRQQEQHVAAAEVVLGERERGHRVDRQRQQRRGDGDDDAVEEVQDEVEASRAPRCSCSSVSWFGQERGGRSASSFWRLQRRQASPTRPAPG